MPKKDALGLLRDWLHAGVLRSGDQICSLGPVAMETHRVARLRDQLDSNDVIVTKQQFRGRGHPSVLVHRIGVLGMSSMSHPMLIQVGFG